MASITDCVVDGLKYPFNDIKKLLGFGIIISILNVVSLFLSFKLLDSYRITLRILENSNGTKDDVIREWNNYCSYEKKDMIEDILRDYKDIDDKANDAIKDDSESEVFAAANDVRSRLRKLHPDLNV